MEEVHENLMNTNKNMKGKFLKVLKWVGWVILAGFIFLVGVRTVYFMNLKKTNAQIEKIHAIKLQMDDVMGVNLPPDPGELADTTIEGIDENNNNIRDDVELAIFKEYPNSAKTRAVLLQYAMALQMEVTQPFINEEIATEVIREQSRADTCLSDVIAPRKNGKDSREYTDIEKINNILNFVEKIQFNNKDRQNHHNLFYEQLRSYSDLEEKNCDVDYIKLPN